MIFSSSVEGDIIHTSTPNRPHSKDERWHLVRMFSGEWALVQSWIGQRPSDWQGSQRLYCVVNRLGSHPTIEQALNRFDQWLSS